jgi:ureidoacrylate peracid hydrolase
MKIVYLKMGFRSDLSDAGAPDAPNWLKHLPLRVGEAVPAPDGTISRILIRDTWNTEIVDELPPRPMTWSSTSTATAASSRPASMRCYVARGWIETSRRTIVVLDLEPLICRSV